MKILQANDRFNFQEDTLRGGTEEYLLQVAQGLIKHGHQVIILFEEGSGNHHQNIKEYQVKGLSIFDKAINDDVIKQIKKIVRLENPDVINIHNIQNSSVTEALINLAPTVRYIHDHRVTCPGFSHFFLNSEEICPYPFSLHCLWRAYAKKCATRRPLKLLTNFFQTRKDIEINKNFSLIHVASSYMKEVLVENGFDKDKIEVLPDFVEYRTNMTNRSNSDNDERLVLFVGRITIEKGLEYLIQAMKKVKKAKLIVIGDGPELEKDQDLVKRLSLKLRVDFLGWLNHQELQEWYQKASVVAFSSVWPEPFGRIGSEAMMHKKPVVGFKVGGVVDWLIDGKNGFLLEAKDIDGLAEKINLLLTDHDLAKKMGKWGYRFALENYSKKRYFGRLIEIYVKAIENYNSKIKSQNAK